MPEAHGAIYATEPCKDPAKEEGRKPEYYPPNVTAQNSFLPCNCEGGKLSKESGQDGTITILSFDENFSDNAGLYHIKISIVRGGNNAQDVTQKMKNKSIF